MNAYLSSKSFWIAVLFVCSPLVTPVQAWQDKTEVLDDSIFTPWLDKETAAFLEVTDVATTYERVKLLPIFQQDRWLEIQDLIQSDESVVGFDRLQVMMRAGGELDWLIPSLRNVACAVHDFDQNQYTLFLVGDSETITQVLEQLRVVLACGLASPGEDLGFVESMEWDVVNNMLMKQTGYGIWRYGEWVLISNSNTYTNFFEQNAVGKAGGTEGDVMKVAFKEVDEVPQVELPVVDNTQIVPNVVFNQPTDETPSSGEFSPLAKDRAFVTMRRRSDRMKRGTDEVSIFVYAKPAKLRSFYPEYSAQEWKGYGYHNFSAVGFSFALQPTPASPDEPYLVADATVLYTEPVSGRTESYLGYQPVTIPYLTQPPFELRVFSRKEHVTHSATNVAYNKMFGEGSAESFYETVYSVDDRNYVLDDLPRRKAWGAYKYFIDQDLEEEPTDSEAGDDIRSNIGVVEFELIKDREAMLRHMYGMAEEMNRSRDLKVDEYPENDALVWRLDEEVVDENFANVGKISSYLRADNNTQDAYVVGQQWYVEGEWPMVLEQARHMENNAVEVPDYGEPIRMLVDDLLERSRDSDPFQIKYYEPRSWHQKIRKMEIPQLAQRGQLGVGNNQVLTYRVVGGEGEGTFSLVPNAIGTPVEESDEDFEKRLLASKRSREFALVRQQMAKLFVDSLGRQVYAYAKGEREFRIILGCYPMPSSLER